MSHSCQSEANDGDFHGHGHGGGHGHSHGGGHGHSHDPEDGGGQSLFGYIDREQITCLNEKEENTGKNPVKPWDQRHNIDTYLDSEEDDPQLILTIPFTCVVKIKSFCIVGGNNGLCPDKVKLFVNRDDIDFSMAEEMPATQEFELHEDFEAEIDYPVKAHKFQNVSSLTLFFSGSLGGDSTRIFYLGFKGEGTKARRGIVECTYEASAQMKDHETTRADKFAASEGLS